MKNKLGSRVKHEQEEALFRKNRQGQHLEWVTNKPCKDQWERVFWG